MTDIVPRLRGKAGPMLPGYAQYDVLCHEAADEIERLRIDYGVVANPERIWQGECGHLWRHEGKDKPACPTCAELERLRAALKAVAAEIERLQTGWELATKAIDENTSLKAELERLRALLGKLRWKSIDKDNMEFRCDITCYVMDEIRRALEPKP